MRVQNVNEPHHSRKTDIGLGRNFHVVVNMNEARKEGSRIIQKAMSNVEFFALGWLHHPEAVGSLTRERPAVCYSTPRFYLLPPLSQHSSLISFAFFEVVQFQCKKCQGEAGHSQHCCTFAHIRPRININ